MFLGSFTYQQRKAFLHLAKQILTIDDGAVDEMEQSYLRSVCSEMSLSINDDAETEMESLAGVFDSQEAKRILIVELVALGYCNSDYAGAQKAFAQRIAEQLGLPDEVLHRAEVLVGDYRKVQEAFVDLIAD